jgi:hypothetical protein
MSALNGDKSRFNRERKQKIARRKKTKELMMKGASTQPGSGHSPAAPKPGKVSA